MKRHLENDEHSETICENKIFVTVRRTQGSIVAYEIQNLALRAMIQMQIFKRNI